MRKKKFPQILKLLLICLSVIFGGMILFNRNNDMEIDVTGIDYSCDYVRYSWKCTTEFTLENKTHKLLFGKAAVRGISRHKNTPAYVEELSEIKYVNSRFDERSKQTYNVHFNSKKKPKKVNVTIVEKE